MQLKNFGRKFWERRDSLSLQQSSWEGSLKSVPPHPSPIPGHLSTPRGLEPTQRHRAEKQRG